MLIVLGCERPTPVDSPPNTGEPEVVDIGVDVSREVRVVTPDAEEVPATFVRTQWRPPSCDAVEEPEFNVRNIDPAYDPSIEKPWGLLENGLVRVRFPVTLPMANVLTVRAGVAISFEGGSVRVAEGPRQPLYKIEKAASLEVLVWLLGSDVIVEVHDASSGLELLTVHARDATPEAGAPSWRGNQTSLRSMRPACTAIAERDAATNPLPRYFLVTGKPPPGVKVVEQSAQTAIVETTSRGLEAAFCGGVALDELRVEPSWRMLDPEFMTWRASPPVEVDGRLKFDVSYKSNAMNIALLQEIHRRFPKMTRLVEVGKSSQGRPIVALVVANDVQRDDPRPPILVNGAYHGDEILSTEVVYQIVDLVIYGSDPTVKEAREKFVTWFVPIVNPDGVNEYLNHSRFSGRKNARDLDGDGRVEKREGVDLNRNFPVAWGSLQHAELQEPYGQWYRGPAPASEVETKAMMGLVDAERFVLALSYHTGTTAVLSGYSIDALQNAVPDESVSIGKVMAKAMGKAPNGRRFRFRKNLYAVEGVDQDWMRLTFGTIAVLVEASRGSPQGWCARSAATVPGVKGWHSAIQALLKGHLVYGRTVNNSGEPLSAPVEVVGQTLRNGERWSSRPRDGRFWRRVSRPQGKLRVAGETFAYDTTRSALIVVDSP